MGLQSRRIIPDLIEVEIAALRVVLVKRKRMIARLRSGFGNDRQDGLLRVFKKFRLWFDRRKNSKFRQSRHWHSMNSWVAFGENTHNRSGECSPAFNWGDM